MTIKNQISKIVLILGCSVFAGSAFADIFVATGHPVVVTLMPYTAQYAFTQETTTKIPQSDKTLNGMYGYIARENHALEIEYDSFSDDVNKPAETNVLAIYTYYGLLSKRLRFGYHQGDVKEGTDFSMGLIGLEWDHYNYYGYKNLGLSINYYNSQYTPMDGDKYTFHQLSPMLNFYLSNPKNTMAILIYH